MHGLLGNKRNNRTAARSLSEQLRTPVIVPDLRNHGTSFHSTEMNYGVMSDDVTTLMKQLPADTLSSGCILVGHSMGAKVAMLHGVRYPKDIHGVVSIDNIPYANPIQCYTEFQKFHIAMKTMSWCVREHPEWGLAEMKAYLQKWIEPSTLVVNYYMSNIAVKQGKLIEKVPLQTLNDSVEDVLGWKMREFGDVEQFSGQSGVGPLLIIRANYSNFVGSDIHTHAISKYYPDFEVADINSGHWVVTEKKNEFVSIVKNWVVKKFGVV